MALFAQRADSPQQDLTEVLERFPTFANLNREDMLVLASRSELVPVRKGAKLFKHGDSDPYMFLLLDGEIELVAGDKRSHRISAEGDNAGQIISRLKPRLHTAIAKTNCTLVRIDDDGIGYWHSSLDTASVQVEELLDEAVLESGTGVSADDDFELPSLPAIAFKARELIDRDDCDVDVVAQLLLNDPSMTAKLIRAANSPVFYGSQGVSSCDQAIVRLGLKTTRHLVVAFAVRQLFNFEEPALAEIVKGLWEHSTEVAAIASVLARHTRRFDPGEAQLAGLLHDVGVIPVLNAAASSPALAEDPEALMVMASRQRAALGSEVLSAWHFPESLVTAAAEAENWHRESGEKADLADIVVVAQLLSFIGKHQIVAVPSAVSVPAFKRVLGPDTGPQQVIDFLNEAEERIQEVRALLQS